MGQRDNTHVLLVYLNRPDTLDQLLFWQVVFGSARFWKVQSLLNYPEYLRRFDPCNFMWNGTLWKV